ncbi:MAG: hypothetical protein OXH15_02785 [Gammaproteobacteria bacterium]|nr:hypothetical protein [Gammaproteobacteria bacterium]
METASDAYRDGIHEAWQGELWGQAFFERLAAATDDADRRAKWLVLAELEEATGNRLAPLIADAEEPPAPDAYRPLESAVAAYGALPWHVAMERMMTILDPAIVRFQELLAQAPAEERDTVQILVDHEVALKRFAERELAGEADASLDPVRAVIERAR